MKSIAIIGNTGKGPVNLPIRVNNLAELKNNFGNHSNVVALAEQLIYKNISPYIIRNQTRAGVAFASVVDSANEACMEIHADSPGFIGTYTTVRFNPVGNAFDVEVYNSGERVEFWGAVTHDKLEIVNLSSNWINLKPLKTTMPIGTVSLSHNYSDGEFEQQWVVDSLKTTKFEAEFVVMPDCDDLDCINEALEHCSDNNLILIIDPPKGCNIFETYKWQKGLSNVEHGLLCWPWVICNGTPIPPSGSVAAMLLDWPFPWQPIRSQLSGIDNLACKLHSDEKAYLSSRKHAINIIGKEGSLSKVITLAGTRLAERRLLNYLESRIVSIGEKLLEVYEPLDANFRNKFMESCEYILQQTKEAQGIGAYYVQINDAINPDDFIVEVAIEEGGEIINIGFKFAS